MRQPTYNIERKIKLATLGVVQTSGEGWWWGGVGVGVGRVLNEMEVGWGQSVSEQVDALITVSQHEVYKLLISLE